MSNGLYWQPNVDSSSEGNFTIDPGDVWLLFTFWVANYVRIKLASPQAAHLSLHLCMDNQRRCTSTRDLFKDTPQTEMDRKEREDSNQVF